MNGKILFLQIIIFFISSISFSSCSNHKKKNKVIDVEKYIYEEIQTLEKKNVNRTILNQKIFFGMDSVQSFHLKDFASKRRIFFWFSQNTCSPCIDRCIDIVKKTFPDYKNDDHIIFVSPDYPARFRDNFYNKKLLTLENKYFGLEFENKDVPFFIILNSNLQVYSIHIVNKNDFKRTEKYLQKIKNIIDVPHYNIENNEIL